MSQNAVQYVLELLSKDSNTSRKILDVLLYQFADDYIEGFFRLIHNNPSDFVDYASPENVIDFVDAWIQNHSPEAVVHVWGELIPCFLSLFKIKVHYLQRYRPTAYQELLDVCDSLVAECTQLKQLMEQEQ